jgi:hypothetical protein
MLVRFIAKHFTCSRNRSASGNASGNRVAKCSSERAVESVVPPSAIVLRAKRVTAEDQSAAS